MYTLMRRRRVLFPNKKVTSYFYYTVYTVGTLYPVSCEAQTFRGIKKFHSCFNKYEWKKPLRINRKSSSTKIWGKVKGLKIRLFVQ